MVLFALSNPQQCMKMKRDSKEAFSGGGIMYRASSLHGTKTGVRSDEISHLMGHDGAGLMKRRWDSKSQEQ